jgi:cytochrome c peroxidase
LAGGAGAQELIGSFPNVLVPPGNPQTPDKILLGQALFFEEQLSSDDTVACATCHMPEAGGGDPRALVRGPGDDGVMLTPDDEFGSLGVVLQDADGDFQHHPIFGSLRQPTGRNSPSAINAAFFNTQFWDARAGDEFRDLDGNVVLPEFAALEVQAVEPPLSSVEMSHAARDWPAIADKLARVRPLALATDLPPALAQFLGSEATYGPLFARVFGTPEVTRERVAMAIASYERTLVSDQAPFDLGTMTARQQAGLVVFRTKGNCESCHPSTNGLFSTGTLEIINLPGHGRRVKVPSLRNAGLRRNFMSSGQIISLALVVAHYRSIGFLTTQPGDVGDLLDFLENALTDPRLAARQPPFDRPTLYSERVPPGTNLYGTATRGSGNVVPLLLGASPPFLGNPRFQVGIGAGLGGAWGLLLFSLNPAPAGSTLFGVPLSVEYPSAIQKPVLLSPGGPGQGVTTFRMSLPTDPLLIGLDFYAQGFLRDPGAAAGISATRGAHFELFTRP